MEVLDAAALDACYSAIAAPDMWPAALGALARSFGAACCAFYPQGAGDKRLALPASNEYRDFLAEFISGGWWRTDHRAERGWPLAKRGHKAFLEHDITTDDERARLPQYHDLYARFDLPWWGAAAFSVRGRLWAMPFLRSGAQGPFLARDRARLVALSPHLERIVGLAENLVALNSRAVLESLELVSTGAMLVDRRGRVLRVNRRAETLLGNGLSLRNGALRAADRHSQMPLDRLMDAALAAASPGAALAIGPLRLRRPDGGALLIDAIPTSGYVADAFGHAGVLVVISDLDGTDTPSAARLQHAFDLTLAEARLAALVGNGLSPAEAALRLGIAEQTARTVLKHVFAKTGVARQSELAALLGRLLPG